PLAVELVTREAPRRLDDRLGICAPPCKTSRTSTTSTTGRCGGCRGCGGAGGCRDVRSGHIDRAALGFEERDHGPHLWRRELFGHHRHDRLIARRHERRGVVERLVQILFAALAGLTLAAASADRSGALLVGEEIGCACAEPVARGAAADAVEDLLSRRHQL